MSWLGRISTFLLFQILFLGIFLLAIGRLPERELGLVWQAILSGHSASDQPPTPAAPAKPEEESSYEDLLRARANAAREIERKKRELESLAEAAKSRADAATAAEKALATIKDDLKKDFAQAQEKDVRDGRTKLLELLEASPPKVARQYLLDQARTDEPLVLEVIKRLEPAAAAKVFKEFKQPADTGKLNGWLAKLGQGEPEASRTKSLKERAPSEE